jgi:RNA polymerase sigma factor (sigma-70 family)
MEASTLTQASRGGLFGRRSPLLKLQGDERLVALIRVGHDHAFEALFERYHSRLLAFCRHMLRSTEDAEDVLQEVFVKAHAAIRADDRYINVRPWLYRIARNRCLNHLRRPVADGQDSMDVLPSENGVTTAERVQRREEFRALVDDVGHLPETQRTALLLREIDALSYEEIAETMSTTIPAVKSLLVRARMSLAEATQSRLLTCGEVRLELAEAAEGLRKATGPVRHHVKRCEPCREYRGELRSNSRTLAALAPLGPLALLHKLIIGKLGGIGGTSSAAGGSAAGGAAAAGGSAGAAAGTSVVAAGAGGAAAAGSGSIAFGGMAAAGAGGLGGAIGAKAAATAATAALLAAGAVEVRHIYNDQPVADQAAKITAVNVAPAGARGGAPAYSPTVHYDPASGTATATVETTVAPAVAPVAASDPSVADEPADQPAEAPVAPATDEQLPDGVVGPTAGGAGGDGVSTTTESSGQVTTDATGRQPPPDQPPASEEPPATVTPPGTDTVAPLPLDPPPPAPAP